MKMVMILAIIAFILFLLSLVRVGGIIRYGAEGLQVKLRLGAFRFSLYPAKEKQKKEKAEKKSSPKEGHPEGEKKGDLAGTLSQLKEYLPVITRSAGRLKRKVRVDRLDLDLIWGSADPAACALGYGYANAAIGMILPVLEHNFNIKERNIRTSLDFNRPQPTVEVDARATFTVGQCAAIGLDLGWQFLKLYQTQKREAETQTKKEVESA